MDETEKNPGGSDKKTPVSDVAAADDFPKSEDSDHDLYSELPAADCPDSFADFEPLPVAKPAFSFREALGHFSCLKWLKSVLSDNLISSLWMAVLFFGMMTVSYVIGRYEPGIFDYLLSLGGLPEGDAFDMMLYIFFNNSRIVFILIFFGFLFAVLPVLIVIVNGFAIGIVAEAVVRREGLSFLLVGLLPHGLIEIPLILLGAGIGFRMGVSFTRFLAGFIEDFFHIRLLGGKTGRQFLADFINAAGVFFLFILPLLLAAAVIEVYLTGPLLEALFR